MSLPAAIGFDYATLPVAVAAEARDAAVRIKVRMRRTAEDIIEIGRDLIAVKEGLGHGQFGAWIEAEFGMGERSAQQFIQVAEKFYSKSAIIADFSPSVLYALAAPSTPEEVRTEVMARAQNGEHIKVKDVEDLKSRLKAAEDRAEADRHKRAVAEAKFTQASAQTTEVSNEVLFLRAEINRLREEEANRPPVQIEYIEKTVSSPDEQLSLMIAIWRAARPETRAAMMEYLADQDVEAAA